MRTCARRDWQDRAAEGSTQALSEALWAQLVALGQVLFIDLVLAGDNAIVVGLAVAGLHREQRGRAIMLGIGLATALRIVFALVTLELLAIIGLLFAGGVLLLWVCWKMYRELRRPHNDRQLAVDGVRGAKTMRHAMLQIVLADVSMSLDNVLAVAGAAREHAWVLVVGLSVSVVLMGAGATLVANLLERYRWLAWAGLGIVLYIALKMIWAGGHEIFEAVT